MGKFATTGHETGGRGIARASTKQQQAEKALRESEERYRLLFEANPNPMWVYDLETLRFLAANEAAVCRYGYARAEFMAMTIKDIRPQEDVQALLANVSGIGDGIDEAGVWRHRKKDGRIIDVEITSHELIFAGRRAELVLANDVTERRRIGEMQARRAAQLALRADVGAALAETDVPLRRTLERCTEAMVNHLGAAFARIWTFNKAENILELQASAGLYTHIDGPHARVPVGAFKIGLIAEERQPHITNEVGTDPRVSNKDWAARAGMVAFAGYPLLVEDRLVGVMAMFARHTLPDDTIDALASVADIISQGIERKRAKEEVQEANRRALIEYERLIERLAALAQSLGTARDLMTIYQAIRGFAFASTACTSIFISLYDAESNTRKAVYAWSDGAEENLSSLPLILMSNTPHSRAISTGQIIITDDFQAAPEEQPVGNIGLDRDPALPQSSLVAPMTVMGRTVGAIEVQSTRLGAFNNEHATALRMAANLAANAIENVHLFARERQHEEQLRQAQKMEAVGQLAGGVAHDFNNLLTAITGYSDLSLRKLKAGDPVRHNIEEVKKAGERAAGLTRQLLAFSRKQVLQPKVINLNNVINNTAKMLRRLIGEDIELIAINKQELGYALADPGQIEQVLMNLAVNARDAMPHGGRLVIEAENVVMDEQVAHKYASVQSGPHVRLTVTDTGCGMGEQTRQRVFEPFFTTKEMGHGTGLGLSTVYGIIKQSNGYISVASELGAGTTFQIYLPRVAAPVEEQGAVDKAAAPGGTESILLVEDEQMVRQFTRNVLEMLGYTVLEAANGDEAVSLSKAHKCKLDLLLTDVVMPGMSARQLAAQVKVSHPEMAVLYMSGYTDDAIVHHGVLEQGTEFLEKPFTPDGLACKVRAVLDTRSGH
ncbi:MAG: GAF domain-containing protein [Pyrinomonadaceae bacterium]